VTKLEEYLVNVSEDEKVDKQIILVDFRRLQSITEEQESTGNRSSIIQV